MIVLGLEDSTFMHREELVNQIVQMIGDELSEPAFKLAHENDSWTMV